MTPLQHPHAGTAGAAYLARLRVAYDGLSPGDRARLAAEVASGDPMAMIVLQDLALSLGKDPSGRIARCHVRRAVQTKRGIIVSGRA